MVSILVKSIKFRNGKHVNQLSKSFKYLVALPFGMKSQQHSPPHPGKILKELYLEPLGLSIKELSDVTDIDFDNLTGMVNGDKRISIPVADKLARVFGTSTDFWNNMQNSFDGWNFDK